MATLSSEINLMFTSWVDGSSEISIEEVESSLDFSDLFDGAVIWGKILRVETHLKYGYIKNDVKNINYFLNSVNALLNYRRS